MWWHRAVDSAAHLQALFKQQLLPATTNGRLMSQTHVPLRFRPKNQWVSVLPWWLGVGHKHECFYFLSGPLPTSYTSRFTDASRWSKELRKYVGLIRFCLVTRILGECCFAFEKALVSRFHCISDPPSLHILSAARPRGCAACVCCCHLRKAL